MLRRAWLLVALVTVAAGLGRVPASVAGAAPADQATARFERPRIGVVWPHDGQGNQVAVAESRFVNVSVWPSEPVACERPPALPVALWWAKDNEPAEPVGVSPQLTLRSGDGFRFPAFEFNDIGADLASEPMARYSFLAFESDYGNAWVHAADLRTLLPQQVVPAGHSEVRPPQIDVHVQVVWPHDEEGGFASAEEATRVNVAVDVFEHGTLSSVPLEFPGDPRSGDVLFFVAEGNGPLEPLPALVPGPGGYRQAVQRITYTVGDRTYPRWVYNDVPVTPGVQYHFIVHVTGYRLEDVHSSIWTHAGDARTELAAPQPPDYGSRAAELGCD